MPHVELRHTSAGHCYHLDNRLITNGSMIELRTVRSNTGWMRGSFAWTGDQRERPYFMSKGYVSLLVEDAVLRWDTYIPPVIIAT